MQMTTWLIEHAEHHGFLYQILGYAVPNVESHTPVQHAETKARLDKLS